MPSDKVWTRFEGKKSDGTVLKLRIQDLPLARKQEVIDIMVNIYARDEPVHKSLDVLNSPLGMEGFMKYLDHTFSDPSLRVVICCSDDTEEVKDIMGASIMSSATKDEGTWEEWKKEIEERGDETCKKLFNIFYDCAFNFDPVKEYSLDSYYDDRAVIVLSKYRGLSIAENFLKVRTIMCNEHGVQMTGAWMTAIGTQKAAARAGWETVSEIKYEDLAKKYDVNFTDVPPTMKLMVARANASR